VLRTVGMLRVLLARRRARFKTCYVRGPQSTNEAPLTPDTYTYTYTYTYTFDPCPRPLPFAL